MHGEKPGFFQIVDFWRPSMSVKKIVFLGAYDRYNYGDNLMPVTFELFLKKYIPDIADRFELIFAAMTSSDLSKYKAKKTSSLDSVISESRDDIHAIIAVGGEILCVSSSTLFLHLDYPQWRRIGIQNIKKYFPKIASAICRRLFGLPWEYPYLPDHRKLNSGTFIAYNTVGGGVPERRLDLSERLKKAHFVSARDGRTKNAIKSICPASLCPDSVLLISDLVTDSFLLESVAAEVKELHKKKYICFQAAPRKMGTTPGKVADLLLTLSAKYSLDIVLLPIGYAKGHDDYDFLRGVNAAADGKFSIFYELNIWEILFIIRESQIFMGTSLHGIVTAMSYSVPYLGINPGIRKLNSFLETWGCSPSDRCCSFEQVEGSFERILNMDRRILEDKSRVLKDMIIANNWALAEAIGLAAGRH